MRKVHDINGEEESTQTTRSATPGNMEHGPEEENTIEEDETDVVLIGAQRGYTLVGEGGGASSGGCHCGCGP
jgi:hypothetical protein